MQQVLKGEIEITSIMYLISNTVYEDVEVEDNQRVGADMFLVLEDSKGNNEFKEFFGGKIPSGILTEGGFIYMYCPQIYETMDNYQQVNGIVYYANNVLHINPSSESYKFSMELEDVVGRLPRQILVLIIYLYLILIYQMKYQRVMMIHLKD